jgi:hypothetical protein
MNENFGGRLAREIADSEAAWHKVWEIWPVTEPRLGETGSSERFMELCDSL